MHISNLINFVQNDEDQRNCLQKLADHRKGDLDMYMSRGIVYIPPVEQGDEWAYISEQLGVEPAALGVTPDNEHLLDDGFMLPITDTDGNILFYLNHNYERDASLKYMNVNTPLAPIADAAKIYGLHNVPLALEWDTVYVLEGYFDALRLEWEGFPSSAPLGTKIMPYHVNFYHRFKRVIYIEDNDLSGEFGFKKFKQQVPHAISFKLFAGYKDVDELAKQHPVKFKQFIEKLRAA